MNLKTRKNNFAPRLGLTYLITDDSRTILRTGYGITYFPVAASASNLLGQQVPYTISQNVNPGGEPDQLGQRARHRQSVPADPAGEAADDRGAQRRQPARPRPRVRERDARRRSSGTSASSASSSDRWSPRSATSAVPASTWSSAGTPTRCSPARERRPRGACSSRCRTPPTIIQCDPRNRSTFHGLQTRVNQRFTNGLQLLFSYTWGKSLDYGGSAASGGGQTGGSADGDRPEPARVRPGFDVRHRAVLSCRVRTAVGPEPHVAEPGRAGRRHRRRLADQHDHHARPPAGRSTWRSPHRRQQRRTELAEPHRLGPARRSDRRPVVQPRGLRRAAAQHLRRRRPRRAVLAGHLNFDLSLVKRFFMFGGRIERAVPHRVRSTCSTTRGSASRTPRSAHPRSAASRRRSWTTAACSSRSNSISEVGRLSLGAEARAEAAPASTRTVAYGLQPGPGRGLNAEMKGPRAKQKEMP